MPTSEAAIIFFICFILDFRRKRLNRIKASADNIGCNFGENEDDEFEQKVMPGFDLAGNRGRMHGTNDIRMARARFDACYRLLVDCDRQKED